MVSPACRASRPRPRVPARNRRARAGSPRRPAAARSPGTVSMIDPRISSHVAPTSRASCAWRRTPAGLRNPTVTTMRMSSWVLRSGACSESTCDIHAFCAAWSCGNTSCSGSSNGEVPVLLVVVHGAESTDSRRRGAEDRDRDLVVERLEVDRDRHPDPQLVVRRAFDVGHHPRAFFELDDGRDVGHPLVERRQVVLDDDRVRVERAPPRRLLPLDVVAPALRAERPRVEVILVARVAVTHEEPAFAATVPERLRLHVGRRDVEPRTGHRQPSPAARRRPRPGSSPRRSRSRARTRARSRCRDASRSRRRWCSASRPARSAS